MPGRVKIVCHACEAQFLVRDSKVRGRRFKARCKRCGSVIVARWETAVTILPEGQREPTTYVGADDGRADDEWYVVVKGKPQGPLGTEEVRARLAEGRLRPRTYGWRLGQQDWSRLRDIPAFSEERISEPGTQEIGTPFTGSEESPLVAGDDLQQEWSDLEGEATRLHKVRWDEVRPAREHGREIENSQLWQREPEPHHTPAFGLAPGKVDASGLIRRPRAPERAGSAQPGSAQSGSAQPTWAAVPRRPAVLPRPAARPTAVGAPRSSSVPLAPVASAGATRAATMARRQDSLSWIPVPNLAPLRPVAAGAVGGPALLLPPRPGSSRRWIVAVVGVVALALVVGFGAWWLVRRARPQPALASAVASAATVPPAAQAEPSASNAAAASATGSSPSSVAAKRAPAPPPPPPPVSVSSPKPGSAATKTPAADRATSDEPVAPKLTPRPAPRHRSPRATTRRVTIKRAKPRRRKSTRRAADVDADAILASGSGSSRRRRSRPSASSASGAADADAILAAGGGGGGGRPRSRGAGPRELDRKQIQRGMARLRSRVQACFDKFKVPGLLRVRTTVQPSGRASGRVVGELAGTPTASCVVRALPSLSFPTFTGPPMTFTYPFTLR